MQAIINTASTSFLYFLCRRRCLPACFSSRCGTHTFCSSTCSRLSSLPSLFLPPEVLSQPALAVSAFLRVATLRVAFSRVVLPSHPLLGQLSYVLSFAHHPAAASPQHYAGAQSPLDSRQDPVPVASLPSTLHI